MSHSHHHHGHGHEHRVHDQRGHGHRVLATAPTFSLLRLSVWQRLAGAAVLLGALWLMIFRVMG